MQLHSLKLTIQDVATKDEKPIAAVFGTLTLLTGNQARDEHGELILDETGAPIPETERIAFTTALQNVPHLDTIVKHMTTEALTLKNLQIAKENGTLSHFVDSIINIPGAEKLAPKRKGTNRTKTKARN